MSGGGWIGLGNFDFELNQWYHLAVLRNGNNLSAFVNGVLIGSNTVPVATPNPAATLQFGTAENDRPNRVLRGKIDDIRIYNRALNQDEIDSLFTEEKCDVTIIVDGGCPPVFFSYAGDGQNLQYQFQIWDDQVQPDGWTINGQTFTGNSISYTFPAPDEYSYSLSYTEPGGNCVECYATACIDPPPCEDITYTYDDANNEYNLSLTVANPGFTAWYNTDTGEKLGEGPAVSFQASSGGCDPIGITVNYGGALECVSTCSISLCESDALTLIIADSICAAAGQTVEVPVTVENFTDITSFNISLATGDPAVAVFDALAAGPGLPPLFGSNVVNNGNTAIVSWFSTSGAPVSLADGTVLFTINVLLGDAEGSCADISFTNTPTPVAVFQQQAGQSVAVTPTLSNGSVCIKSDVAVCGRICRENGDGLVNVSLSMTDGQDSWNTGSNPNGSYCFDLVPAGSDYTITPEKNTGWTNGVTANDLYLIQRHILQIELLDSPYKIISADADASGLINGNDLFQLQRLILLQIPTITGNRSWRFVPKNYVFSDPFNPFNPPFSETLTYNNLNTNITDTDFYACKIGDVDLSAINMSPTLRQRQITGMLDLFIEPPRIKTGTSVVIPVKASNFRDIAACQFTLEFNSDKLLLEEVVPGYLPGWNASNFGLERADEGLLPVLWYNPAGEGAALDPDHELFSLRFKVLGASRSPEELIRLSSRLIPAIGFRSDGSPADVQLTVKKATGLIRHAVIPNPFTTDATLSFDLDSAQPGRVVLFNQFGQTLKTYEGEFAAGRNDIPLGLGELPGRGVLFYEIQLPTGSAAGRMIRIRD